MLRHAYLIMAFNNFRILDKLIELLDCENNDFYIHIDKKVQIELDSILKYKAKKSKIYFTDRVAVNWGSISELRGNLILMKAAYDNGPYDYYHFMQGADFPIKPLDYINSFFEKNKGKEFLNINPRWTAKGEYNFLCHHFFMDNTHYRKSDFWHYLRAAIAKTEKFLHIKRGNEKVYAGSAMWTLSNESIKYLLDRTEYILRRGKNTYIPVELVWHTLLMQDKRFVDSLYKFGEEGDNLYLIDWNRMESKNSPHLFKLEDYDMLINSAPDMLYARKFNENIDFNIIEKLFDNLKQ